MKCDKKSLLLYAVTDRSWLNGETLYSQVEKALQGGATFIQLREKNLDQDHFMEEALELKKLCAAYHVPFVINDNMEIAAKMDADGVHVGQSDMERAAKEIGDSCGCAVLLKGGHSINDANDLLYHNGTFTWFTGKRIDNPNTHGTGCTLSSAIASGLAKGLSLPDAISAAKEYISGALASMMDLGHGSGPLNHAYRI